MKFSDAILAVATMAVVAGFISYPLDLAFVSALGLQWGYPISSLASFLISALVGGYIFAGAMQEARREAIAKITVLWGVVWIFLMAIYSAQPEWGAYITSAYHGQYGATLTANEWVNWESVFTDMWVTITLTMAVVTSIIGPYIGSMLRKPRKS